MSGWELNNELTWIIRLVFAGILGGLIGFDREFHGRDAGFRTHVLVSVGACLMVVISESFAVKYNPEVSGGILRLDPSRVAAQIVTGIGFLGAGAIIKEGATVKGLTTAACLWVAAGMGMAVGTGLYFAASFTAVLSLFALLVLKKVERYIRKGAYWLLTIQCFKQQGVYENLKTFFEENNIEVVDFSLEKDRASQETTFNFTIQPCGRMKVFPVDSLVNIEYVKKVFFR